jgi:acetoin utilization protein AcuC
VFWEEACRRGLDRWVEIREPAEATRGILERFHAPGYLDYLHQISALGVGVLDLGDTPAFPGIYEAAAAVAGTTVAACESLMAGECSAAFIPIAGLHHARRDGASGFCALNDCGVAIETLKRQHGLQRIAYVDIDVHHADGVFYAFEDDPAVIFADVHEDGRYLYPGTGTESERGHGTAKGKKLNIPLAPNSGDRQFLAVWERVETFIDAAQPQFILFQCGADSLAGDLLGDLVYSPQAHAHAAQRLKSLADRHCPGRLLAMGGGGYNLRNVASAWCAVLESLIGAPGRGTPESSTS